MSCSRIRRAARATEVMGSTDAVSDDITSRMRRVMGTSRSWVGLDSPVTAA
ncbi:hypothetical protein GCM10017779_21460 [Streptomyces capillispiralis]|nr:hypothetical protein GCM10017779_21460 [Streptomyces capillispiralis]